MKKKFLTWVVLIVIVSVICSCNNSNNIDADIQENNDISIAGNTDEPVEHEAGVKDNTQGVTQTPETDTTDDENVTDVQEIPDQTPETEVDTTSSTPAVGGSDYSFLRKYIDEVYNIQVAYETVGKEARDEWVNNVFLKKSAEEQEALPPIYQMIVELEIPKDELIKKNDENDKIYLADSTIEALYYEDVEAMKKALASPLALYYDGEIYTFDGILGGDDVSAVPVEALEEFFDRITLYCEQNKLLKYEWENIDKARRLCGLAVVDYSEYFE